MPTPTATGGTTHPHINPLAAINQEAYDAEHGDAVNLGNAALTERVAALRGDLDAMVAEAGEDFDVSLVRTGRQDTHQATLGFMVDHHSRLTASQEVLNQRRSIQAAAMRRARGQGRHEDDHDDLLDIIGEEHTRPGGGRLDLVSSVRAAMTEQGVSSYIEAARHRVGFEIDVGVRPLAATLQRGTIGGAGNQWTSDAGYPPWSDHSGRVVALGRAGLSYLDLIPMGGIGQAAHIYDRETLPATSAGSAANTAATDAATDASAAAARAEGGALAESTFKWERQADPVQSIGHFVPVTEEQLADAPRIESLLEMRMAWGVRQRLNIQIGSGNGTAPNLKGFSAFAKTTTGASATLAGQALAGSFERIDIDRSDADTGAKRGKAVMTNMRRLMTLIETTGATMPSGAVVHPGTWSEINLLETSSAGFYFGDPRMASGMTLWGLPIAYDQYAMAEFSAGSDGGSDTAIIALMGDFAMQSEVLLRHDVRVEFGLNDTDFRNLRQSVRAYVRAVMSIYRIKAFAHLGLKA